MPLASNDSQVSLEFRPRVDCKVCNGTGWVCEKHPNAICPRECRSPEMPCEAPGCLSDWFRSQGLE
jgi:hypothetical protein